LINKGSINNLWLSLKVVVKLKREWEKITFFMRIGKWGTYSKFA